MPHEDDSPTGDPPFEDVVAALLKVDPTGITGKRAKRRDGEGEGEDKKKAPPPK